MHEEQEFTIDILALLQALWKNILIIALVAVLVGSAFFVNAAFWTAPQFQATASLYVNRSSFDLGSTSFSVTSADLSNSNSLVNIYLYILRSRTTLEEVIKAADLSYTPEQLRRMISSTAVSGIGAFEVTVTSSNPAEVELIANTIAKVLPERISEIVDGTSVRVVDYAIIPAGRSGPNVLSSTQKGILIGAVAGAALVVLYTLLTDRSNELLKSAEDLHALYPDMMVLAMIPDMRRSGKNGYYSSYYGPDNSKKGGRKNGDSQ